MTSVKGRAQTVWFRIMEYCHLLSPAFLLFRFNLLVDEILVFHYLCQRSREAEAARARRPEDDMLAALWCRQRGCGGCGNASLARRASFLWRPSTPPRELYSAWSGRVGASAYIPSEKVQQLFNDLQLYPSKLEVVEMLRCAQQRAQRTEPAFLTYEEFSLFAKELKRAAKGISWTSPLSLDRDGEDTKRSRTRRRTSTRSPQVFLGGSCNPTTWRQDVAIPLLQDLDITFYNPQVSDWAPELIEKEHFAKTNAEVLFFVIDNQTRNTASTVEVAFYSGLRKQKLVLVVHPYQSSGAKIAGEEILDDEWRDLISSQRVMQLLAERQGMPFFSNIRNAIDGIDKVLREKVPAQELQSGKKGLTQINESGVLEKEAKENVPVNFDQFSASVVDPKSNQESEHFLYNDTLGTVGVGPHSPSESSSSSLGSSNRPFSESAPVPATDYASVSVADSSRNTASNSDLISCSVASNANNSVSGSDWGHVSLFQAATVWCGSILSVLTPFGRFLGT